MSVGRCVFFLNTIIGIPQLDEFRQVLCSSACHLQRGSHANLQVTVTSRVDLGHKLGQPPNHTVARITKPTTMCSYFVKLCGDLIDRTFDELLSETAGLMH